MKPIDSLTPEELRVEIAESRGYTFRDEGSRYPNDPDWQKYKAVYRGEGFVGLCSPDWMQVPHWDSDANAALTLAAALAEKGWKGLFIRKTEGGGFEVEVRGVFNNFGKRLKATATGPHAFPLAMCRAYLAVIRSIQNAQ